MEISQIVIIIVSLIISIFSITSTSIGIQVFNDNESTKGLNYVSWKESHMAKFNFLVISLVVSIIFLILSFVGLYLYFRG
jgi:hypothetical protein